MRCTAENKRSEPCGAYAVGGSEFCYYHDPKSAGQRARSRKRGGLRSRKAESGDPSGVPDQVRTVDGVLQVLDYTLAEALALENGIQRGRLFVAICGQYLQALQVGELETRLARLEELYHGEIKESY